MYSESKQHKINRNIETLAEAKAESKRMKLESETTNKSQNISTNLDKQAEIYENCENDAPFTKNN